MNQEGAKGLESLQIWQLSLASAEKVCRQVLPMLPKEERWALVEQLRRSVQSIPANIAEGYGRYYYQDAIRYCYIARGSLEESFSHLTLASNLGYIEEKLMHDLYQEIITLRQKINGYIGYLKQSKRGSSEPGSYIKEEILEYEFHAPEFPNHQIDQLTDHFHAEQ